MKALLVSLGSIGRRHLANLRGLEPDAEITVLRRPESARQGVPEHADHVTANLEDALCAKPDLALITSPAPQHIDVARRLAAQGVHLFVEKPISNSPAGVDELIAECRARRLVLTVGYDLRFCRSLQMLRSALIEGRIGKLLAVRAEVGQYLPDWRPSMDYRSSVSARASLGGGVVLELSHEIDYVLWLAGEVAAVSARLARVSDLDIDVEDTAEITLHLRSGGLAHIHLDMVQRVPTRTCRLIGAQGVLEWEGIAQDVRIRGADEREWRSVWSAGSAWDGNEPHREELRQFLDCIRNGTPPAVTGENGRDALKIALAAIRSCKEGRVVEL